ncbi:MAG TPA: hypothetical protein VD994_11195 [Prosthecobacter sp.]|nr:hypothetical protein [Prosthecobacter sp.]
MNRAALYDLADRLYRLEPWMWMREEQIIGLKHPETGEMGYLSVMGASGIHRTLAVYLGEEALHRFNLIQEAGYQGIDLRQEDVMTLVLESRQLQMNFCRRQELFAAESAEIKALKRKYRGENWPCFRSFKPGHAPARAEGEELRWLEVGAEQILALAPALRQDLFGDTRGGKAGLEHMTREWSDGEWRTVWRARDQRLHEFATPSADAALVAEVAALKAGPQVECQFELIPAPIGEEGSAVFPYLALTVDSRSGAVLGMEMLSLESQSHAELIAQAPNDFLKQWLQLGVRPARIQVATATTAALLDKTAKALKMPLQRVGYLPALDQAVRSLQAFMRKGQLG